jgi:hypothetical protein
MNKAEQNYKDAFNRLKAGKPKIVHKSMPINELDTIALEAGKKKGSLRRSLHSALCDEILGYHIEETPLAKETRLKEEYKHDRDAYHKLWSESLARELMIKVRLEELENEISRIKQAYPGIVFKLENI